MSGASSSGTPQQTHSGAGSGNIDASWEATDGEAAREAISPEASECDAGEEAGHSQDGLEDGVEDEAPAELPLGLEYELPAPKAKGGMWGESATLIGSASESHGAGGG
ncbi:uncharacterized protein B0H18DRAFT_1106489 [Fomitopsis serialis]|uniref:uncharacterized protein n=1 Tax=Fomitopsis serialis TaxID=139415 RepID=UPI002007DE81|nr:uncharacterized protein B0H18DRAFT_1106489 [Neoantrodia serialis]KAH9919853.1 hypothetical protein B0H18DRAFT_1106489 [Neoantrodia serialis]